MASPHFAGLHEAASRRLSALRATSAIAQVGRQLPLDCRQLRLDVLSIRIDLQHLPVVRDRFGQPALASQGHCHVMVGVAVARVEGKGPQVVLDRFATLPSV